MLVKTLGLLRHAKSDWDDVSRRDFDRGLNERGRRGAAVLHVVRDGQIVVRPMLPLTLSFDHAVIDGAPAARFTETLRELVESAAVLHEA